MVDDVRGRVTLAGRAEKDTQKYKRKHISILCLLWHSLWWNNDITREHQFICCYFFSCCSYYVGMEILFSTNYDDKWYFMWKFKGRFGDAGDCYCCCGLCFLFLLLCISCFLLSRRYFFFYFCWKMTQCRASTNVRCFSASRMTVKSFNLFSHSEKSVSAVFFLSIHSNRAFNALAYSTHTNNRLMMNGSFVCPRIERNFRSTWCIR